VTYEDALEVLGLRRILAEKQMRVQRDEMVRDARARSDEEREKLIHQAWAVLTGKEEAALADLPAKAETGAKGTIKARCGSYHALTFVLDWTQIPRGQGAAIDDVVIDNPQVVEWDRSIDGYVRIDRSGLKIPYAAASALRGAGDGPIDDAGELWKTDFKARVRFEGSPCPHCKASELQWCQHCNTVFCHFTKEHYADHSYKCPSCSARYVWGGSGRPIATVFDGKQLRSLTHDKRKEIAAGDRCAQITHKED
jgi:hypothetical protein